MSFPGFVPVRQLVLVDLLSLILSVRPGERAIVAIDGVDDISRSHVARELTALAQHVAGRQLVIVAMDRFRAAGPTATCGRDIAAYSFGAVDYERFLCEVWQPFRIGPEANTSAGGRLRTYGDEAVDLDDDTVLLVEGVFLHRPEMVSRWDASVFISCKGDATGPQSAYLDQSPDLQATWVLDNTSPAAPLLTFGATTEPTL